MSADLVVGTTEHGALRDPLTGLPSRELLVDRISQAVARLARRAGTLAVLHVDLDDFRAVNDGLGYAAGDALLVAVADRLSSVVRTEDTVARIGADAFAVLLLDADSVAARAAAARVLAVLAEPIELGSRVVPASGSVGVTVATGPVAAEELLRDADLAANRAKRLGPGRVACYEPELRADALARLELKADLEHALGAGQLRLVYQPIVTVHEERTVAVEALLRWDHPSRGLVSPGVFIPLAEETGVIVPIGRWVLREACRQVTTWPEVTVSVNVSPRQLQDPRFIDDVAEALADSGLAPSRLVLELTEGVLVADLDAAERALVELKRLGVAIAIDDFGTGFASLTYLQRFPVDVVKIDKSFIDTVAAGGEPLLRGLLELTRLLNVTAVAEGVEGEAEHRALRALGCGYAQGYHYARPGPAQDVPGIKGGRPS